MRLKLRILQEENDSESDVVLDPLDSSFVQDDTDLMDWWSAKKDQDIYMDEFGYPPRPSQCIVELIKREISGKPTKGLNHKEIMTWMIDWSEICFFDRVEYNHHTNDMAKQHAQSLS